MHDGPERAARAHVVSAALAAALLGGLDLALAGTAGAVDVARAVGLGVPVGGLLGLGWALCFHLLTRCPAWVRGVSWGAVALAVFAWVSLRLNITPRLFGPGWRLAWTVLAAGLAGGLLLGGAAFVMQPSPARPRGLLGSLSSRGRLLSSLLLLLLAAGAVFVDRTVQVGYYLPAHLLTRWLALFLAGFAIQLLWPGLRRGLGGRHNARLLVGGAALLLSAHALLTLHQDRPLALERVAARPYPALYLSVLRSLADPDRDGYASLLGGGDCAPLDPAIHPGAREVPNNGVDDNCLLGDLPSRSVPSRLTAKAKGASPTSVVLITVDAMRADHLGAYGHDKPTSPNLDAWAKDALRFDRAYTSGAWTSLALPSMFRGLYPRRLQWTRLRETTHYRLLRKDSPVKLRKGERFKKIFMLPLDDPNLPMPRQLRRRGMLTAAVVDDGYTHVLSRSVGGFPGFDHYEEVHALRGKRPNDRDTTKRALRRLRSLKKSKQPFFMWVHYFGPHAPSTRHKDIKPMGPGEAGRYDAELAYTDRHLGKLLKALDKHRGPLLTMLTSDHGEELFFSGRGHGRWLREASIRIPLLIKGGGFGSGVSQLPVSLVDVAPTVLAATHTPAPPGLDGVDLLHALRKPPRRVLHCDTWRTDDYGEFFINLTGAFDGQQKLVLDLIDLDRQLTRQDDPSELNLVEQRSAPHLEAALNHYVESHGALVIED